MPRTLVVLVLLFAVVMSDNVKDKCKKEAASAEKCWKGCETKHPIKIKKKYACVESECKAKLDAEMECLRKS
ncbi:unnamed protein product [Nippostrongylus brasiliensis]|uniref:Uncharacterized protein n=1 Tax=Nippostrongylus brasiliensis TaxID=27835 RepID=A0A0N4YYL0_NIPBR|nr:unnamed protein product [Nippostrongylus brasiliensis]